MSKIVLKYGLFAGLVLGGFAGILFPILMNADMDSIIGSQVIGYSAMVISFLAVFFGIRRYREDVGGGAITFGKAFKVGILIALIGCAMYVIGWQIAYWGFIPDFGDKYAAATLRKLEAEGASAAEIAEQTAMLENFKRWYRNPFLNVAITFLEVFPLSLLITLISAGILRKRAGGGTGEAVAA
jgi:Protein of unknown function (DUF4199)